jgi:hypothetical protein
MKNITQKISLIITLMCLMSMSLKAQCVAGLSHNAQQYNGIVYFYDNSTATLGDTIHTYNWNFGDGVTSTQKNPVHAYSVAGLYTVTLYVTDGSSTDGEVTQILMTVPLSSQLYSLLWNYRRYTFIEQLSFYVYGLQHLGR